MYERRHTVNDIVQPLAAGVSINSPILNYVLTATEKLNWNIRVLLARKQSGQNVLVSIQVSRSLTPIPPLSLTVFLIFQKRDPTLEKVCVHGGCPHNPRIGREGK